MIAASPGRNNSLIVWQQSPKERIDRGMSVHRQGEWHRKREWKSLRVVLPVFAIAKREASASVTKDPANLIPVQEDYQLIDHDFLRRFSRCLSMSTERAGLFLPMWRVPP